MQWQGFERVVCVCAGGLRGYLISKGLIKPCFEPETPIELPNWCLKTKGWGWGRYFHTPPILIFVFILTEYCIFNAEGS